LEQEPSDLTLLEREECPDREQNILIQEILEPVLAGGNTELDWRRQLRSQNSAYPSRSGRARQALSTNVNFSSTAMPKDASRDLSHSQVYLSQSFNESVAFPAEADQLRQQNLSFIGTMKEAFSSSTGSRIKLTPGKASSQSNFWSKQVPGKPDGLVLHCDHCHDSVDRESDEQESRPMTRGVVIKERMLVQPKLQRFYSNHVAYHDKKAKKLKEN
jgi:hypothetical protein